MPNLRERHLVAEQMDADDADPAELAKALRFIRRINALLRYNASMAATVSRLIESLPVEVKQGSLTLLDVAAGSGDLLVELHRQERCSGRSLQSIALDRHAVTVEQCVDGAKEAGVGFVRAEAVALPFEDRSIDIVISTLFLHHLPESVAVAALAEMRRVARHGVVVADLIRDRRAYAWIRLFTLFASPMVKHDARASVAHAFTVEEAERLTQQAGMEDARFDLSFGHRFVMTWKG
jgi:ubiquinone/menaquinone biosynthesis C-methylase UbiE